MKRSRQSIRRIKKQLKKSMQDPKCLVTFSKITDQACYMYGWDKVEVEPGAYKKFMWMVMHDILYRHHTHHKKWREP